MDSATKIKYKLESGIDQIQDISSDFYMSDKDLQATMLIKFKSNVANSNVFVLSACNSTKKILVKNVDIYTKNKNDGYGYFPLNIETSTNPLFNKRALFYSEVKSPDKNLHVVNDMYYWKNSPIPYNAQTRPWVDQNHTSSTPCIKQITRAIKNGAETSKKTFIDLKGKVLMEQDEYDVETWYKYDNFGNITKKTIRHPDMEGGETIIFNAATTENQSTEITPSSFTQTNYDNLLGNVVSTNYRGEAESATSSNIYTTTYIYDLFGNRLQSVHNNVSGNGNMLEYDEKL